MTLGGIPALHVAAAGLPASAPTILYYHGWSSQKENDIVNPERVGCAGHSMGAMATAGVLARYAWVRTAETFNGATGHGGGPPCRPLRHRRHGGVAGKGIARERKVNEA